MCVYYRPFKRASSLIVMITAVLSLAYSHDTTIYISESEGRDNEMCLKGNGDFCQSLEFVARKLGNGSRNITIILNSLVHLTSQITFANCEDLTIAGSRPETKITCECNTTTEDENNMGILFVDVHNLLLYDIYITRCCGTSNIFHAAVLFNTCSNIRIERVEFVKIINGSAAVIENPYGTVNVTSCRFTGNGGGGEVAGNTSYAGGLHIQFSTYTITNVTIFNCTFKSNKSPKSRIVKEIGSSPDWNGRGLGGGMGISFLKSTTGSSIQVRMCTFVRNDANWGGGLSIYVQSDTLVNNISIVNTLFLWNNARLGGGGIHVRLGKVKENQNNHVLLQGVRFVRNSAMYGGGLCISAHFTSTVTGPGEFLSFNNCTWYNNSGLHSPAVYLSPSIFQQSQQGYLPIPLFKDVMFESNHILVHSNHITEGVFVITRFSVYFQGSVLFKCNRYSALYLTSARAIFDKNSNVTFQNNQAIKGAAIGIYGFSAVILNDNSFFQFINNSAARVGGGIFYISSDQREYFEGKSCFLIYGGNQTNTTKRNIFLRFQNNKAPFGGTSIYSESLFSCYFAYYDKYTGNMTKLFDRIATFQFDTGNSNTTALATAARSVHFKGKHYKTVVPGESLSLPLAMYDEFKNQKRSEFDLRIEGGSNVYLDNYYSVHNSTRVYGASNQSVKLILSTPQPLYGIEYIVFVTLLPCPPGFFYEEVSQSCKCSADSPIQAYPAITKCVNFKAFIKNNYWVGYYPVTNSHPDHLYTAFYPSSFNYSVGLQELPKHSNKLSSFMCGDTREGVLCGKCKAGYSAYYHSREMTCGTNGKSCRFGVLIYLLSEIVPTAVFFTVVVIFGVNFSSGSLNGIVFFSQILDVFSQNLLVSHVHQKEVFRVLLSGYQLIYGILNFDYFVTFPFCLWKGATIMDVMVFKYVTITFAFALITSVIVIMNRSGNKRFSRISTCTLFRRRQTHGISTVLIICYGQCTKVGFSLLARTYLKGRHGVEPIAVTHFGGLPYFGHKHLLYAIPATIFTIILVGLPPLCLLLYPFYLHLLEACGLSEHACVQAISRFLYLSHFMPLFDSFQSYYKDRMRFFAGLYFLYRVVAFLAYMYGDYAPPVVLAAFILGVHSVLQPYKCWQHNAIDSLIFLNLTIISSLATIVKLSLLNESTESLQTLESIQLVLIYLPCISFLLIIAVKIGRKMYLKRNTTPTNIEIETSYQSTHHVTHTSVSEPLLRDFIN